MNSYGDFKLVKNCDFKSGSTGRNISDASMKPLWFQYLRRPKPAWFLAGKAGLVSKKLYNLNRNFVARVQRVFNFF